MPAGQALIRAAKRHDIAACHMLLALGLDPNTQDAEPKKWPAADPSSLLNRFVHPEYPEAALAAVLGYDQNGLPPNGAIAEPIEIVTTLLDHGADPRGVCTTGEPVICRAAYFGYARCVQALLNHGASVSDHPLDGANVMQQAICSHSLPTVKAIVKAGWKPNLLEVELTRMEGTPAITSYLLHVVQPSSTVSNGR